MYQKCPFSHLLGKKVGDSYAAEVVAMLGSGLSKALASGGKSKFKKKKTNG